jgi:CCR4-NOT transcription complex subunit 7/8
VLNEELEWISFHGTYDFAYFLKLVTCDSLPDNEAEFQNRLKTYFPHYYDVKCLLKDSNMPGGSLSKVASNFGVTFDAFILATNKQK